MSSWSQALVKVIFARSGVLTAEPDAAAQLVHIEGLHNYACSVFRWPAHSPQHPRVSHRAAIRKTEGGEVVGKESIEGCSARRIRRHLLLSVKEVSCVTLPMQLMINWRSEAGETRLSSHIGKSDPKDWYSLEWPQISAGVTFSHINFLGV